MAEGDSILRLARRMDAALGGSAVRVRTPGRRRPQGRPAADLDGRTLSGAESRGKHLLLRFDGELVLHSHLGMRGSWHLYRPGERWRRPAAAAWIALEADGAVAVNFDGSSMRIVRKAELGRDPRLARLGPDLLDPEVDPDRVASSLERGSFDRELGDALLDQTLVAGIGNIFKSEGCFAARLDPWRKVRDLKQEELALVARATRDLMLSSAESGRARMRVYRRARMPCPRCGAAIRAAKQGDDARTTYWCAGCQG
jgi:endonuclease VIII